MNNLYQKEFDENKHEECHFQFYTKQSLHRYTLSLVSDYMPNYEMRCSLEKW